MSNGLYPPNTNFWLRMHLPTLHIYPMHIPSLLPSLLYPTLYPLLSYPSSFFSLTQRPSCPFGTLSTTAAVDRAWPTNAFEASVQLLQRHALASFVNYQRSNTQSVKHHETAAWPVFFAAGVKPIYRSLQSV